LNTPIAPANRELSASSADIASRSSRTDEAVPVGAVDELTVGFEQVELDLHKGCQVLPALPTEAAHTRS
jgi:hypothetical protein